MLFFVVKSYFCRFISNLILSWRKSRNKKKGKEEERVWYDLENPSECQRPRVSFPRKNPVSPASIIVRSALERIGPLGYGNFLCKLSLVSKWCRFLREEAARLKNSVSCVLKINFNDDSLRRISLTNVFKKWTT